MTPAPIPSAVSRVGELSDERLAEMLAGLEGVTPGPWDTRANLVRAIDGDVAIPIFESRMPWKKHRHTRTVVNQEWHNLNYIARCDPDTMRSALTELLSRRSLDTAGGVDLTGDFPAEIWAGDFNSQGFGHAVAGMQGGLYERYVLASRTPNTEMVVKALEWKDPRGDGTRWAKDPYGGWIVATEKGWGNRDFPDQVKVDGGLPAAMKAAEANHQAIILSALASPPSPAQVTDEQIAAGKVWFDQNFNGCPDTETLVEGILRAALAALQDQTSKEG